MGVEGDRMKREGRRKEGDERGDRGGRVERERGGEGR